jgi:DMSO/TMAO reductase YedYZ molybdopterin-dependent catalytic subunit
VQLLLSLLLAVAPGLFVQSGDSLVVELAGRSVVLRSAELAMMPRDTVQWPYHGTPHSYSGVRVIVVLRRVGVPIDSLKGRDLTKRVVIEAADRYRAVFTLAEIAPGLGGREVLLADSEDGHPLPSNVGPWRLVVPGDGSGARGVRQVAALPVRDEPQSSGQPSN